MNVILVGVLTIALICTGISYAILKRFSPMIRGLVASACGYMTVQFAAEPITSQVGLGQTYTGLWFFATMVVLSCVYFFFFTKQGFVLGYLIKNQTPLITPIPGSTPINDPSLVPIIGKTNRTVELNTQGAKTVWEM